MHRYMITSILISSCVLLQGATPPRTPTATLPFSIIDSNGEYVEQQYIGFEEGEHNFNMRYYPKDNPFIVFGQKSTLEKRKFKPFSSKRVAPQPGEIETCLNVALLGNMIILLHSKSGNYKNLKWVHRNFFKHFDDKVPLHKGRLQEYLRSLSTHIVLYEEHAIKQSSKPHEEQQNDPYCMAKLLRQKDDFVKCRMSCFALGGDDGSLFLKQKEYSFGLPYLEGKEDTLSKFFTLKTTKESNLLKADISTYGLLHSCKESMNSPEEQAIITRNIDKLGLLLAAYKYGHEVKNSMKPQAHISSFVMFNIKGTDLYARVIKQEEEEEQKEKEEEEQEEKEGKLKRMQEKLLIQQFLLQRGICL